MLIAATGGMHRGCNALPSPASPPGLEVAEEITFRHPTSDPAALKRGDLDAVLGRHLPHER